MSSKSSEDGDPQTKPTTADSEANKEPDNLHVATHLPNYLINPSKKGEATDFLSDVSEDGRETGLGYDSDDNADEIMDIDDEMHMVSMFKTLSVIDQESNEDIEVSDRNMVQFDVKLPKKITPEDIKIHCVPNDWEDPAPDTERNEPPFELVDNPGNWSSYSFRPVFKKEGGSRTAIYKHHCLPTGCIPVEKNEDGRRIVDGWEFFYNGWSSKDDEVSEPVLNKESEEGVFTDVVINDDLNTNVNIEGVVEDDSESLFSRNDTTKDNLFPESRLGCLDAEVLKKLGLTSSIMKTNDFLFFFQLILPICDVEYSGVSDDGRLPYYSKLEEWSNLYAYQIGLGGSYGHEFKNLTLKEILQHDGCIVRDGVRGGSSGAIYRRWQIGADYDDHISMALTFRRWLQIKRVKKLCNNDTSFKRNHPQFDPTYKYDYIFKCIINNVNYLTKRGELDATIDETTFATASPGEAGSGVTFRVMGKPNVSKGGQTVVLCDAHRIRPRAYYHRHKLQKKPDGWTAAGMIEARRLLEQIAPMVEGSDGDKKKIYNKKPHITMDNYFSGEKTIEWIGRNGFGATMTCRRDRLPPGIPTKNLHKQKTDTTLKTKIARFFHPVVAVKTVEATDETHESYRRVHVSFQSTSSCNISTVNALSECSLTVAKRERGAMNNKRTWGIEMNAGRELYLGTYSRIDSIDHLIKNCRLKYRSWKYWHSPMLHATSLAICVAYDIYLEIAEGQLDSDWKIRFPVDFWTFRDVLSIQMLEYDPKNRKYLGDESMRVCTKQKRKDRGKFYESSSATSSKRTRGRPSEQSKQAIAEAAEFKRAKQGRGENSRLCGNLSRLDRHIKSVETALKHPKACRVCGGDAYSICGVCGVPLHFIPTKGKHIGKMCFFDYHDDAFFGLAREDTKLTNARKSDWTYPSIAKKKGNAKKWSNLENEK